MDATCQAPPTSQDYTGDYEVDVRDFEEARWQRGACLTYAEALKACDPTLRWGIHYGPNTDPDWPEAQYEPMHVFVHDEKYAYDSLGRHPLPYDRFVRTEYRVLASFAEDTDFREDGDEEEAWEHVERRHPQYRAQARMLQAGWRFMPRSGRWYVDDAHKYVPQEIVDYIAEPEEAPRRPELRAKYPWAFN